MSRSGLFSFRRLRAATTTSSDTLQSMWAKTSGRRLFSGVIEIAREQRHVPSIDTRTVCRCALAQKGGGEKGNGGGGTLLLRKEK